MIKDAWSLMSVAETAGQQTTPSQPTWAADHDNDEHDQDDWVYYVDSAYDPNGDVPLHAVVGRWPVDEYGQLGPFSGNPDYRPTPAVLGMDEPTDAVDAALQLALTGHGPESDVVDALSTAEVYLPCDEDGELTVYQEDDGEEYVAFFTDPAQAPSTAADLLPVDIRTLLDILPEKTNLIVNPESRASAAIARDDLLAALAADEHASEPTGLDPARPPATSAVAGEPDPGI